MRIPVLISRMIVPLILCGCAIGPRMEAGSDLVDAPASIEAKDKIEAVGMGIPNGLLPEETQRKAMAREEAIGKARYDLTNRVEGLTLASGIAVWEAMDLDPSLEEHIRKAVYGASISQEFTEDEGCVVRLSLSKTKLGEDLGVRFR